ncbi:MULTISPECIES: NAD(P)H-dependent glycerol-3-phosphate dehydrogenase [Agrobacterium]|uniref:NAD(P)H-dependent glycerol-3-phosphate dehydrogenase n=1 Tax=Agrobacterium TaxID=357 RepID=UPI0009BA6898|nr:MULTISPECIES: NAD(P)H-dependent glycerol-3-phosphate dehydrogenase [Agrobacterium]QCL77427.1 NAD(P)H-dependent glycerol-3-phosphate dehydrogenase [Agrobacterium tumefaciens]CUX72238.1 putative Glycerol-3-phosphate dehydrogenase (NAD(P)+) [Agrobacterium sp. NCPPB 925]
MKQHAVVLGDGTMATALAARIAKNEIHTVLWSKRPEVVASINKEHRHPLHFTSYGLPHELSATESIEQALNGAGLVIMAVKSGSVAETARLARDSFEGNSVMLSATKGVEIETYRFMSGVIREELRSNRVGIISGPNITTDIMDDAPTAILVAAEDVDAINVGRNHLESQSLKVFGSTDLKGIEALSVVKNIVAIAAGLAINLGDNARSYIISLGLSEIQALAKRLGARPDSSGGLADIGEVFLSSTSKHSRNHMIGVDIANGAKLPDLLAALDAANETAEGVNAVFASRKLAEIAGIEMPLAECVFQILYDERPATETLRSFLSEKRAAKWLAASAA